MTGMLSRYFGSVLTKEDMENIPKSMKMFEGGYDQMLTDIHITEEMVAEGLGNLRKDNTSRIDIDLPKNPERGES